MVNEDSSSASSCSSDGRTSEKRALSEGKQRANTPSKKPKLMEKEKMNSNAKGTKGKAVVVSPSSKSKTKKDREIPMKEKEKGKGKKQEPEDEESSEEGGGDEESGEEEDQTVVEQKQQQKQGGQTQHQQQVDTDKAEAEDEEVKVVVRRSSNNFKRTWTDNEEIFLLKLVEKGGSPADADFIPALEKSFQKKYSRRKVTDKLRRLKARYKKNRDKKIRNVPLSLSPHQTVLFNLSNNVWEADIDEETSQPQPQPQPQTKAPSLFKAMVETGVDARVMSWGIEGMTDHRRAHLEGGWKKFCRRECNHVMKQSKFVYKVMASIIPLTREDEDASEG